MTESVIKSNGGQKNRVQEIPIFTIVVKAGLTKGVKSEPRPEDLKEGRVRTGLCGENHSRQQDEPIEKAKRNTPCVFKQQHRPETRGA